jgi:type III restriction enzyme
VPTETENAPIVGESSLHTLAELKLHREAEIDFRVAQCVLETYFRDDAGAIKPWLFPQLLAATRRWRGECLVCKDDTFPQMLLWVRFALDAADRVYHSIMAAIPGRKTLKPILYPYDVEGTTRHVDFDTVNFTIPYTMNGESHNYVPDFVARVHWCGQEINLILEVTGQNRAEKQAKVATARTLWIPAVNNHGAFGRWAYYEVRDPWNAKTEIRAYLNEIEA